MPPVPAVRGSQVVGALEKAGFVVGRINGRRTGRLPEVITDSSWLRRSTGEKAGSWPSWRVSLYGTRMPSTPTTRSRDVVPVVRRTAPGAQEDPRVAVRAR